MSGQVGVLPHVALFSWGSAPNPARGRGPLDPHVSGNEGVRVGRGVLLATGVCCEQAIACLWTAIEGKPLKLPRN